MQEGAERITRRIVEDSQSQAESIKAEAAEKANKMADDARRKASKQREQILEQAGKDAAEQKRRIIGVAQLEARKELLSAKQEHIEEAFRKALEGLGRIDDQAYLDLIAKMLLSYTESGTEEVIFSAKDRDRIAESFWQDINSQLKRQGKMGKLVLSDDVRNIIGGFVLKSEGIEINCSFTALLEMQRDELENEVASLLFS